MQGSLNFCRWNLPFWCPTKALASVFPAWKCHLIVWTHAHFFVHPLMKMDMGWQTRSVLGTQKPWLEEKWCPLVPSGILNQLLEERDFFSVFCLLVRQHRFLLRQHEDGGKYYERPGLSCVRCYYKRVFVAWGRSSQVVPFYCALLVLS